MSAEKVNVDDDTRILLEEIRAKTRLKYIAIVAKAVEELAAHEGISLPQPGSRSNGIRSPRRLASARRTKNTIRGTAASAPIKS